MSKQKYPDPSSVKYLDNHQGCENFVHNESSGEKVGHKWRLKTLWEVRKNNLVNVVSSSPFYLQHLAAYHTTGQDIEKTWERIQVFGERKCFQLKLDAGPCGQVGRLWARRDEEGLAEVWVQH